MVKYTAARQHAQWESTAKTLILVTLLLYPNVSTRTFSVFRCTKIQNGLGEEETMYMLSVDMKHECWSGLHLQSVGVAITGLLVYVLGVPAVIWYLLWKNRAHLWDETSPKHKEVFFELGGLYSQYERGYTQFELVAPPQYRQRSVERKCCPLLLILSQLRGSLATLSLPAHACP